MYKKNPSAQILLIIVTSIVWLLAINMAEASHSFLRYPDVHGDQLVFTTEADLWLASISSGLARRITTHVGLETNAHFSPDGRMLAFNAQYDGGTDVYVMSVEGGTPKRLTWDPRGARVVGWTPDGTKVLYISRRSNPENQPRLWQVPVRGGLSSMLPIPRVALADMAPDGERVVYVPVSIERHNWKHYKGGRADNIWLTNIAEQSFKPLIVEPRINTTPIWAADAIYFISERQELGNLYRLNPVDGLVTQITNYSDTEARYPSSDGKTVVFQHGDDLALYDIDANQVRELEIQLNTDRIHTRIKRVPASSYLNSVAIGPTGKRVVIEARGQLVSLPVEEGANRILAPLPGSRSQYPAWSKDGKKVAFISDRSGEEQVWTVSATGLENPRQLTKNHKGPLGTIEWSPDGKYLVTADREQRILLVDTKTGTTTVVDQSVRGGSYGSVNYSATFSPDGKWLAFHHNEPNSNRTVHLYNIEQQKKIVLTSPMLNAFAPCWDPEGKFLYFLADRQFNPSRTRFTRFFTFEKSTKISYVMLGADVESPFLPTNDEEAKSEKKEKEEKATSQSEADSNLPEVKIDLAGLTDRIGELPVQADRFRRIAAVEGRLLMLVTGDAGSRGRDQNARGGANELQAFNLKSPRKEKTTTIAKNISDFQVSGDNNKLLIRKGQQYSIIDAHASSLSSEAPKIDIENVSLVINPIMEWKQIFDESWRVARDFFYAPNMHGVDWEAVRSIYEPRLEYVAERSELNEILGDMIGELNTSHARAGGGDLPESAPRVPMGYLGADYEPDAGGKAYRIIRILKGDGFDFANRSPLLEPGLNVNEGDYIMAIDGQAVHTDEDIQALLVGTANRVISLTINSKPSLEGSRQILVTPLADERKARYYAWTESRREYVRKNGGPNLGYIHMPNMDNNGLIEFTKHYYPNLDKDGMIYDDRFNSGGYISSMLILHMARKPITWFKPRYGISWTRQSWGFAGYSVALVNENSSSNGEEFPDIFRREKLGPVIGVRTWGGEVGSGSGYRLIDGGRLNIPNYANWVDGEWIIEGTGVEPDILVEQDPKAVLEGRDPQLDRAIAYLKEQIAAKPVHRPTLPRFPVKVWRK